MSTINPFATLGLSPGASETDIKKSFRKMALVWHPDKNPHRKDEATKKFQDINDAYNILSDAKTRRDAEAKWRTTSKASTSAYYAYGSTPSSSSRAGGWASSSSQHHWDDPFPDFPGWSHPGFYGGGYGRQQQQQSRSTKSRSKNSAYNFYSQRDNSNRYAYDSTPTGSKAKPKAKPRPRTETKPKPEPKTETKPRPTPKQETKPKASQFEDAYSTPPQFKSTADPSFNRKTGYSYTSGERYRPGATPNVKPPVYEQQQQEEETGIPFNFERQRQPHSNLGKGEKFKMYDEPPPKNKPTSGSFNFTMPDMRTSEPSSSKGFREDHSFVFDQDENSEESEFEEDLPDPNYRQTRNPFGFNKTFVDLTNTDDEVEELSPDEYAEIAREAQKRKDQERREELINEHKEKAQRARAMFGEDTSSSDEDEEETTSSDSDQDASMFEGGMEDHGTSSNGFFGSSMFGGFDKDVLNSMFNFSIGSDSPQAKPRRRPMAAHRRRKPQTYAKSRQPYVEEVSDADETTPFTPRNASGAPPSKKVSPDFKQTPMFDFSNVHPFNETNGNFGMDEIRSNIDQMGGDKVKTEKGRPIGEDNGTGRFRRSKNTTSEPVNTASSSAFKPQGASSYTKLNIDLATDNAALIHPPDPPSFIIRPGESQDAELAQYFEAFHTYQQDMETFQMQCQEYRNARMVANNTHRNALNSTASYRKANIEARETDALVLEAEYAANRKYVEALEKYDVVVSKLR
ncbi:DnaJ-like protein subfamily B member 8 [Yarrowia sp. B02]|nr:DnaJ-like protein subfamily B member 8 [Yarrowia sp. B02]